MDCNNLKKMRNSLYAIAGIDILFPFPNSGSFSVELFPDKSRSVILEQIYFTARHNIAGVQYLLTNLAIQLRSTAIVNKNVDYGNRGITLGILNGQVIPDLGVMYQLDNNNFVAFDYFIGNIYNVVPAVGQSLLIDLNIKYRNWDND